MCGTCHSYFKNEISMKHFLVVLGSGESGVGAAKLALKAAVIFFSFFKV